MRHGKVSDRATWGAGQAATITGTRLHGKATEGAWVKTPFKLSRLES